MAELDQDLAILCSGREGHFSLEDTVCAGMLVSIIGQARGDSPELNDAARSAFELYQKYEDCLWEMLQESDHGKYLVSIGFEKDLEFCAQADLFSDILVYKDGRVIKGTATVKAG